MMAPRKKLIQVLERDLAFTEKVGKPYAYDVKDETVNENQITAQNLQVPTEEEKRSQLSSELELKDGVSANESDGSEPTVTRTASSMGGKRSIRLSLYLPSDLIEKVEVLSAATGVRIGDIVNHAFERMRADLIDDLHRLTPVPLEKMEKWSYRYQPKLTVTQDQYSSLEHQLDPGGFGKMTTQLNNLVRPRLIRSLEVVLAEKLKK